MQITIIETRFGYNVQVTLHNGHVISNASDGILCIAERFAYNQAKAQGYSLDRAKKTFISLI